VQEDRFSARVLQWFASNGRTDLPWQVNPDPYRVWVSEIMLQQTQVATVIPYYERFMQRYPTLVTLADAPIDAVLHLWSGLGYYARARNLHRAAIEIRGQHQGCFPQDFDTVVSLPGIGRSTAGAILTLALDQRHAILDGNVKRVLCRYHAVAGWPGQASVHKTLWALAESHLPDQDCSGYTQAMMDLGATLCTRSKPDCPRCPLSDSCEAAAMGRMEDFPEKKPKKDKPVRDTIFLLVTRPNGDVMLQRRPAQGIWGGLWGFPELNADQDPANWCVEQLGSCVASTDIWNPLRHTFSHFHLDITPTVVRLSSDPCRVCDGRDTFWVNAEEPVELGLSAPVRHLLDQLHALS
jgi:A/G-specific adenine glycosylase